MAPFQNDLYFLSFHVVTLESSVEITSPQFKMVIIQPVQDLYAFTFTLYQWCHLISSLSPSLLPIEAREVTEAPISRPKTYSGHLSRVGINK